MFVIYEQLNTGGNIMCGYEEEVDEYVAIDVKKAIELLPKTNTIYQNYKVLMTLHLKLMSRYCYLACKARETCAVSTKQEKINRGHEDWEEA